MKPSIGHRAFSVEAFLITDPITLLVMNLFRFSVLCDSVLGGFVVLGLCPCYLVVQFVREQLFIVLSIIFFFFFCPMFTSDFNNLSSFFFLS